MAHTVNFRFQSYDTETQETTNLDLDTIPTGLETGLIDVATFKNHLLELYTNKGGVAACGTGKMIFGNDDDIYGPVLLVSALVIQYQGNGVSDYLLVFHLVDYSASFQVTPVE